MAAIFPPPPRPFNQGYLPLCYDSKTPLALSFQLDLWTDNYTLRHSRTVPFHPLYISSLPPLLLYFSISFRPRIAGYPRATETPRSCLEESALLLHTVYRTLLDIFDRVTTVPAPSYKSPDLAPRTSLPARVNFGPRSTPIVSINEIYVANARKGT